MPRAWSRSEGLWQVTGRLLKASGKMEDRASQALAWRVGCSADCRARGKGPLSIAVQNTTTWNRGTVRTRDTAAVDSPGANYI